jgi:NAD(P)-dependent dehydrogenase (short-subunit alcohol dehydrogenase family)
MAGGDLTDRTAIVTGASRGIGLAIASALISAGASVVVTSRHQKAADEAAGTLGPRAIGCAAHAVDAEAANTCVALALERFGSLDILVNNAGTNVGYGPVVDQDHKQFTKTFDLNLWAPLLWTSLAWHGWMKEHGGAVVNTASVGGLIIGPGLGLYDASKAAVIHLTKQLALELGPKVRVNAIAPGVVRTRLAEALWKDNEDPLAADTPLARIGEPGDIGAAVAFLASDGASWITGETLVIDGGQRLVTPSSHHGASVNRPLVPISPQSQAGSMSSVVRSSRARRSS